MKSKKGENDYCMFINENYPDGEGGFKWEILDFKPEDAENYRQILVLDQREFNDLIRENMELSMMENEAQNAALKYKIKWLDALEQIEDLKKQMSKK